MIRLNGHEIKPTLFPDKTSQVWKVPDAAFDRDGNEIEWRFEHEGEFLHVAQLKTLLSSIGLAASLYLHYLPYGRQDKPVSNRATFALRTFCGLVNSLGFERVIAFDPHSAVAEQHIERFRSIYPAKEVTAIFSRNRYTEVCYPDRGALLKYSDMMKLPYLHGEKTRDQATGNITEYVLKGYPHPTRTLIVDDICDGGMTFILLAHALKGAGANEIGLYVSHGIFSKGVQVLRDAGITRIFTKEGEIK